MILSEATLISLGRHGASFRAKLCRFPRERTCSFLATINIETRNQKLFYCVEARLHLNKESNKSRRFSYFCKNTPLGPKGRFRKEMKKELSTFGAASAKRSDGVARAEPNLFKLCRVTTEFKELKLLHLCRVVTKVMERSDIT